MNKIIAITIGDINGIGIEILIEAWKKRKIQNFILFSDLMIINKYLKDKINIKKINIIKNKNGKINYDSKKINIYSFKSSSKENNTYKSLIFAYKFCYSRLCIGVITLPLRKDLIKKKVNKKFIGHTEFFQKIDQKNHTNMILVHRKIMISTLTTHIEIKKVSKKISKKDFIINQLFNLYNTLRIDFNIKSPKIIISGLNPHAGENGQIGKEENDIILPALNKLKFKGILIDGPASADSVLLDNNLKKYHCFVFMYHDQALIPFKYISQFSGVNYTGNLSIIRTSPDHGTAYNLIGSKNVSNKSFINCFRLIKKIYKNRMIHNAT